MYREPVLQHVTGALVRIPVIIFIFLPQFYIFHYLFEEHTLIFFI